MKKKGEFGLNAGISSILVIVVILCLVCFAGLSVASANADRQLSDKLSSRTSAYYAACSEVYTALGEAAKKEAPSEEGTSFSHNAPIGENQELRVRARLYPDGGYDILQWQIVTIKEPELDQTLHLYTGN